MSLNLLRIPVRIDRLARWAVERGWAAKVASRDEGRALHHLLTEIWGRDALTSFRLFVPPHRKTGNVYAYTEMPADDLREAAMAHAPPEHLELIDLDGLGCKTMPTAWQKGQRIGFDLRFWPVRKPSRDVVTATVTLRADREIDAFLFQRALTSPEGDAGPSLCRRTREAREAIYFDWLDGKLGRSATLDRDASRLAKFRLSRAARGKRGITGPDATVHGTLTVTEPTGFSALLARGVGRQRAYGYGMLLLRPPQRAPG